ncbi:MAG: DUF2846 domain-containing protein [Ferruginibacter sp.]
MTKFLFTALAVLSCTLSFASNSFPSPHTSTDSGFVYIYRVGQFGGALSNFSVFVDGQKLCKISNNKYFKVYLTPGTHTISAKVGGLSIMKKETEVELEVTKGSAEYYVACNMKTSITRARLEMIEVTKSSGKKQMENMSEDKCQEKIDKE